MNSLPAEQEPHDRDELTLREHSGPGPVVDWQPDEAHTRGVDVFTMREDLPPPREPLPGRPVGVWILSLAIVAAGAGAVYVYFVNRQASAPVASPPTTRAPAAVAAPPQAARPLGGDVTPIDLPPLDQSDPVIRTLVKSLSSHPRVVAWLATKGLIRNFTVVVANIAEGRTPATHLQTLSLSSSFQVIDRGSGLTGDARNYRRYDTLAAALASLDPAAAARLYASIRPRIEEAYRELGYRDMSFDRALERAIVVLLDTPAPDAAARLTRAPKGVGYRFADQRMEALTGAQKQLLRAGPANVKTVQAWLRAVANALGIQEERLPPAFR